MSASRFKSLLLSFLILFSSGCLGEDSQLDDGCDTRFLDSELEGVWEQHRHEDLSNRSIEYYEDGSKSPSSLDPDFSDLEYCWNVSYNTLSEEYQVDSGSADMGLVDVEILSFYHIDGELLFLATQHMTQSADNMMDIGYDDNPTQCTVYAKQGAYSTRSQVEDAITNTAKPSFCTWIEADPAGGHPGDAFNATYLAQDHPDAVSSAINDNLMTIELDEFYGEVSWYVSEGYFGFWVELTVEENTYQCSAWSDADCTITFSGNDSYYAVWEQGEIATLNENGINICTADPCEITISDFGLREEDTLNGTTSLTLA